MERRNIFRSANRCLWCRPVVSLYVSFHVLARNHYSFGMELSSLTDTVSFSQPGVIFTFGLVVISCGVTSGDNTRNGSNLLHLDKTMLKRGFCGILASSAETTISLRSCSACVIAAYANHPLLTYLWYLDATLDYVRASLTSHRNV